MKNVSRKNFIKTTATTALGASLLSPSYVFGSSSKKGKLRVGVIGTGERGKWHLKMLTNRSDVVVKAICDINPIVIKEAQAICEENGHPLPNVYSRGENDYQRLLERHDIDAVIIATPWLWHVPMAIASMKAGKYTGLEVSGLTSVQECWDLVNAHEETGTHLFFLENVCYRRDVMAILNMVRKNMFGELIHLEGGYQHDLRHVKFNDGKSPYGKGVEFGSKDGYSESKWRTQHSVNRNGELYPTHGLGPAAMMLNLERGNRMISLTSTASKARGLHNYIVDNSGKDHKNANIKFNLGDVVTTVIKTYNGETINLQHDTNLPRPYSLGFRVQGTKGIWMDINNSLYIEGVSKDPHGWESDTEYMKKYDHPLWKRHENDAVGAGHGGMDFFLLNSFVNSAIKKETPQIDVYDAATWSVITPLSEKSIALGSHPVTIPDFSRGKWIKKKPTFTLTNNY